MDTPPIGGNTHALDLDQLRAQLATCSGERCPKTESTQTVCPLHELRKQKPERIWEWLDGLNSEELDFLVQYQQGCRVAKWNGDCSKDCSL